MENIKFSDLPNLRTPLAGGTFAGITTTADGQHVAVVLLPVQAGEMSWDLAQKWAKAVGGVVPTRPVAAMLFSNCGTHLVQDWHWTSDVHNKHYAWWCDFYDGEQKQVSRDESGECVAIRLIPIVP